MFLHFIATGKFEPLGILVLSRWRSICIQASHIQNPVCFRRLILTLFKLPDPGASIYVQNLLKFPTWGGQGRSKSPPRPVLPPPPSGITLIAALIWLNVSIMIPITCLLVTQKRNMEVILFWCICRVNQDVLMLTSWNLRETGLFVKCCDLSWEVNSRASFCNIRSDWKQNKVFSKIFYGNELCFLYITWKLAKF